MTALKSALFQLSKEWVIRKLTFFTIGFLSYLILF